MIQSPNEPDLQTRSDLEAILRALRTYPGRFTFVVGVRTQDSVVVIGEPEWITHGVPSNEDPACIAARITYVNMLLRSLASYLTGGWGRLEVHVEPHVSADRRVRISACQYNNRGFKFEAEVVDTKTTA